MKKKLRVKEVPLLKENGTPFNKIIYGDLAIEFPPELGVKFYKRVYEEIEVEGEEEKTKTNFWSRLFKKD